MRTQQLVAVQKNRWHLLLLLLFEILWKITVRKFLRDQNIMAQLFRYFNYAYLFFVELTLAFATIYIKIMAPKLAESHGLSLV